MTVKPINLQLLPLITYELRIIIPIDGMVFIDAIISILWLLEKHALPGKVYCGTCHSVKMLAKQQI